MHKSPEQRTEVLSAPVEDLRKPNSSFSDSRIVPLLQCNPVRVWQGLAAILAIINVVLLILLGR